MRLLIKTAVVTAIAFSCLTGFAAKKKKPQPRDEETETVEQPSSGTWGLSGAGALGDGYFGLKLAISYFWNPFIGAEVSGSYTRAQSSSKEDTHYQPELAAILRLANPTSFTPFVGAGPGWDIWTRKESSQTFDEGSSPLAVYFAGLGIGLSSNLSLQLKNTWRTYLGTPPKKFGDHSLNEKKSTSDFSFGLAISF